MVYYNIFNISYKKTFPFVYINKSNMFSIFFISLTIGVLAFFMETTIDCILNSSLIDRGFLVGPFIPLYFIIVFFMLCYIKTPSFSIKNIIKFFLIISISITIIEYLVGNISELIIKESLWSYKESVPLSDKYVSLIISIIWGILGVFILFFITPLLYKVSNQLNSFTKTFLITIFLLFFISDLLISISLAIENKSYNTLYEFYKINDEKLLSLYSLVIYFICSGALLIFLNIFKVNKIYYFFYFITFYMPFFTFLNSFINYDKWILNYFSTLGVFICIIYLFIVLIATIKKVMNHS